MGTVRCKMENLTIPKKYVKVETEDVSEIRSDLALGVMAKFQPNPLLDGQTLVFSRSDDGSFNEEWKSEPKYTCLYVFALGLKLITQLNLFFVIPVLVLAAKIA